MNLSLKGAGTRFAHLLGLPGGTDVKAKAEGDDDNKKKDDEKDADKSKAEADDDDAGDDDDKKKDKKDDAKSKSKAKAKTDGPEDEDEECKAARAEGETTGMTAERKRWSDVMASEHAAGRVATACALLSESEMSAAQVIKVLASTPTAQASTPRAERLADRMKTSATPSAGPGAEAPAGDVAEADTIANKIVAAHAKARGEKSAAKAA